MQLRHIELLQAIFQTGSLTAAAELLHISQPAASKALQLAEQQLGYSLFNRVRGKLLPTAEARILQQRTASLASDLQDLRRLSNNLRAGEARQVRLICIPTLAHTLLAPAVSAWRQGLVRTPCELSTRHTDEMIQALLLHEADIGLTLQPVERSGLQSQVLASGRMMAIAPPGYWTAAECKRPIQLSQLSGLPLIGLDTRDALGGLLHRHIRKLEPGAQIDISVQTYQLARHLVAAGQGLALVDPFTALCKGGNDIQVRHLEPVLRVSLYQLQRTGEVLGTAEQALLLALQQQAEGCLEGATSGKLISEGADFLCNRSMSDTVAPDLRHHDSIETLHHRRAAGSTPENLFTIS